MPTVIEEVKTYKVNGVEIFSAGVWNGDKYEVKDLHDIVQSFNALKVGFRPYLKLGHDAKQAIAKSSGLPALGWVENVYVRGNKLLADFDNIPEKLFKLIKARAYRKVSCEVYWNLDVSGEKYPRVLGAVALLGAENPGVMNLDDILGQYEFLTSPKTGVFAILEKQDTFKSYSQTFEMEEEMPDNQEQLDAEAKKYAALAEEKKVSDAKIKEQEDELKNLREIAKNAEADKVKLAAEKQIAETKAYITSLESKKLVTPAMKPIVEAYLSDAKEYSVGEGDKAKKYSRNEMLEEILKLSKESSKVNLEESSTSDAKKFSKEEDADAAIKKYMAEQKCDYATAYKAVMKEYTVAAAPDVEEEEETED